MVASVKIKLFAVLAAALLTMNANLHINLYEQTTKMYLSAIDFIGKSNHNMVMAKSNHDQVQIGGIRVKGCHREWCSKSSLT